MDLKHFKKILIPILLLIPFLPGAVRAFNVTEVGDYQIRLFTEPDPPVATKELRITFKVLHSRDNSPVNGAKVFVSTKETLQDIKEGGLDLVDLSDFIPAKEADEFGNYEVSTTFQRPDNYYIRVVIKGLKGNEGDDHLSAGFSLLDRKSVV